MRFDVHKAIVCQSPFFHRLLKDLDSTHLPDQDVDPPCARDASILTIDLVQALLKREFILAPFQHIVRRKWQKPSKAPPTQTSHLLASHIRFAIQWLYSNDMSEIFGDLKEEDTLRILLVAVLFDMDDLAQACVERYITHQLSIRTITRDLEYICQLPRAHPMYLQLRNAALLLLFRYGPEDASSLALLPVDYMADVLSADLLFVANEYERYCLLRQVLVAFMQSVGKITWTQSGPVDQENKRLSGFVRPASKLQSIKERCDELTAEAVRSRKRKRIPSQELIDSDPPSYERSRPRLSRVSFSSCVPFEKLVADASSGGVIDKATVLSYLLRTTVNYSNMTFDQLTTVRNDGIVDEGTVFRALWQREALERIMFPFNFQQSQLVGEDEDEDEKEEIHSERSTALNEYFDVDNSENQARRRRILLGVPRFRFRVSVRLTPPSIENGWVRGETKNTNSEDLDLLEVSTANHTGQSDEIDPADQVLRKSFYSRAESVLGTAYRVQVEAHTMPRHLLHTLNDEYEDVEENSEQDEDRLKGDVLVCRFELQREIAGAFSNRLCRADEENTNTNETDEDDTVDKLKESHVHNQEGEQPTKIRYSIFCLNRHDSLMKDNKVDPEDHMLVPVTEQAEREQGEPSSGYVDQVVMDVNVKNDIIVNAMVALEIFGFQKV
ncbi:hypothetical protein DFQ28_008721 [Apophysomyces sp. BC1034]|nr:hypothetical protein DFQ28_008721 [Apophysomyces sp. BC1034]